MWSERIFLSKPDVGAFEEQYVVSALRSGWIAPLGPDVDAFEAEMSERIDVNYAVALSSGTAALHLGLLALGVQPGDTVITSTLTFAATVNAILYTGATPFFIDSDPVSGNMDPALLARGFAELADQQLEVAAVVPVDLLGKAIDYTVIEGLCDNHGVPMLADAAESLGATHQGKPAGGFGKVAAFSFNGNKIMTTSGGGMLLTDDGSIASQVRYLATQARQPVLHYEHTDIGYNYRMSNLLAALGRAQLARLDEMIQRRRYWRNAYREFFDAVDGIEIFGGADDEDNCWLTAIIVDPKISKVTSQQLLAGLSAANIEARPLWKPMHLQPVFAKYQGVMNGTSEAQFENGLALPSGSTMTEQQFQRILTTVRQILEEHS